MNNLASYNWLKEYCKTDVAPEIFARELSLRSMSVEKTEQLREKLANIVVGVINGVDAHPNADKLRVVQTDIGGRVVGIVCGGTNLKKGMRVCVALPGAKVRWHGEGDLVELAPTVIRGVESYGMICAPAEVGFEKLQGAEREIWDLTKLTKAAAGEPLATALELDDTLFDIEITTNRPDAMGVVGLAREAAAALEAPLSWRPPKLPEPGAGKPLRVSVDDRRCRRYMAVVVDGVRVGPSPWWLQKRLLLAGHRPINNIVDITNYVLTEYGQPLHAFDYAKLAGGEIRVRAAVRGEKLRALDGKDYELDGELVIADAERPVAVAGVMGGLESGTTEATTTVVFEAAAFDGVTVRRTARDLNLYSDSQLLFEKGLSTEALPPALAQAIALARKIAKGGVASEIIDVRTEEYVPRVFTLNPAAARAKIGVDIPDKQMVDILKRLGFTLKKQGKQYAVTVPYWRAHDIEADIDLTEEIARIYGYHAMPSVLPTGAPPVTQEDTRVTWERWFKRELVAAGYDELFHNSFVHGDELARYGEDIAQAYAVSNPLSPEQGYMRTSLVPSILRSIEENEPRVASGRVFELARVYEMRAGDLPNEAPHCVFGEFGAADPETTYRRLRGTLNLLGQRAGVIFELERLEDDARWHPGRSAHISCGKQRVGVIGQVSAATQEAFGVRRPVLLAQLNLQALEPLLRATHRYVPIGEFPSIVRDVSLMMAEKTSFADVVAAIRAADSRIANVELVDIYRGVGVEAGEKSVTLSLTLQAPDRTLTSQEADVIIVNMMAMLVARFPGVLRERK